MSDAGAPSDPDFEQASLKLNEGLKTCRAVICGYRALLVPEQHLEVPADKPVLGGLDGQDELFGDD